MDTINVLVVDDEADFTELCVKRLRKRQIAASGVSSGCQALDFLAGQSIDVVVLDVRMPGMDGLETLKAIKKAYPAEVILITGHDTEECAEEGMNDGAAAYLIKPFDIEVLARSIRKAFRKKRIKEAQPAGSDPCE
ncbi:MAG: hypothetical protein BWK80_10115 [Desulfobacteraceae bacterium IS3]|nr:MAG: hypothetical protein BWK80_10115 [Desulfobacteraceae bacterium IS3]